MELDFIDLGLILKADDFQVQEGLSDEMLFISVKQYLLDMLSDENCPIYDFGYAPDNTADGQDELLHNGTLIRIIVYEKFVGHALQMSMLKMSE